MSRTEIDIHRPELALDQLRITTPDTLLPEHLKQCLEYYFSPLDSIHQRRREALKRQVFASPEELARCLEDSRVSKIVVTDAQDQLCGVLMATQQSKALSDYGPSHLTRVESDSTLPFFQGFQGWPSHYQILNKLSEDYLSRYSQMLKRQTKGLDVQLPDLTRLNHSQFLPTQALIDQGRLWINIDALVFPRCQPPQVHQGFLAGLFQLNHFQKGLLFHHYPHPEAQNPLSLAQLPQLDTVDAQAYWSIDLDRPPETDSNPETPPPLIIRHVNQTKLGKEARDRLRTQLTQIEHAACGIEPHTNQPLDKLNRLPYPILVAVDQEYPQAVFDTILSADPHHIGLYVFQENGAPETADIHGYFVIVTPEGSQLEVVQNEVMSENPHVPAATSPYLRIAAFVGDTKVQAQLGSDDYRRMFTQVQKEYLPDGGSVISDTDAFLGNLRLIHILKPEGAKPLVEIQHNVLVAF